MMKKSRRQDGMTCGAHWERKPKTRVLCDWIAWNVPVVVVLYSIVDVDDVSRCFTVSGKGKKE